MLHAQLQRQVHLPEPERPRVPLLVDEAHYVAGGENVLDQIATHRAAGLEPAFGLQYATSCGRTTGSCVDGASPRRDTVSTTPGRPCVRLSKPPCGAHLCDCGG
jgi:hypothetical protein